MQQTQSVIAVPAWQLYRQACSVTGCVFLHCFKNKYKWWYGLWKERELYKKQISQPPGFEGYIRWEGSRGWGSQLTAPAAQLDANETFCSVYYAGYVRLYISYWFLSAAEASPWHCLGTRQAPSSNEGQQQGLSRRRSRGCSYPISGYALA